MHKGSDYTVNQGVNLAEVPKAAFGPWETLPRVGSLVDLKTTAEETKATPETAKASKTSKDETATATAKETAGTETPDSNDRPKAAQETNNTSETYLPPLKYIKGDPNYDVETNPLGTQLAAPLTGLYLVSAILGVGIIAHALGTARRYAFRRQYFQSLKQSKAGYFAA
ncbi:hypothetical protein EC988_002122 [Linderina pennispora]|nr:hypothetical protein EC988_002122 [Linderina pennispora]